MSNNLNLTDEQIKALALSADSLDCLLGRLAVALGRNLPWPARGFDLVDVAASVGISAIKAHGIMDGWDVAGGGNPTQCVFITGLTLHQDYWDGRAFGEACYKEAKHTW